MKRLPFIIAVLFLNYHLLFSQVAVNTTGAGPDPAAMLDVSSTSMGVLVPRLTTVQRTAIPTPPEGLLLYDTDTKSFWYVKNSAWTEISPGGSGWSLTGNAGTDPAVNFIGTTDSTAFKIRVNNRLSGFIDPNPLGNTGFGYRSLSVNTTGDYNTAFGYGVLFSNTAGEWNTANGFKALFKNTTGSDNTANGYGALYLNTTGVENTANGSATLFYNTTGYDNTANGVYALCYNSNGYNNSAFGSMALWQNTSGYGNIATGSDALYHNTTGYNNTAFGFSSLYHNHTGNFNVALGSNAGYLLAGGNHNLFIGSSSGPSSSMTLDSSMWLGNTGENEPAIYGDLTDGRIGIGTTTPDNSALLDMSSTSKGFLPPRMSQAQISAISDPADGLIVYCISDRKFYAFVGGVNVWKEIYFGSGTIVPPDDFVCGNSMNINHTEGNVAPVSKTVTYATVTGIPGEPSLCWITSNLGSDHQAESVEDATEASAGWYWQFNRKQGYKHDGVTLIPTWPAGNIIENLNWLPDRDPCSLELGTEWRLPTESEYYNIDDIGSWTDWNGPWNSALKLHAAGILNNVGDLEYRGYYGTYWSSIQTGNDMGWHLFFTSSSSLLDATEKTYAFSVRCVREIVP